MDRSIAALRIDSEVGAGCGRGKVSADPGTVGVLGYSFLAENADKGRPIEIGGVMPTEATIQDLSYPGARKLYVYVKGEHMQAKPALREFVAEYARQWVSGGELQKRGLVPLGGAEAQAANAQASALKPLDAAALK